MSTSKTMTPREWGMLVTLSVLWGGSFFFVAVAIPVLPPLTIVFLRVALAACALHLILLARREHMPGNLTVWTAFLGMGFLNNAIPFTLIAWGQSHIESGLASILMATTPLFTVVLAHFFTSDERLTAGRIIGVVIGLGGVTVMIGPALLEELGALVIAQFALLGAAVAYAFAAIYGRRFKAMGISPLATATGQVTASSALMLPVALIVDEPWNLVMPGVDVWLAVVGLALLSTALAYILYFRILATAGATNILLVTFLIPVSAILLGALVLGERLDAIHFIGMALIALGLAAIDGRAKRMLVRKSRR
jgi:drug/metabolite transporter (DMT)-like permease